MVRRWCGAVLVLWRAGCAAEGGGRLSGDASPPPRDQHGQIESPGEGHVRISIFDSSRSGGDR